MFVFCKMKISVSGKRYEEVCLVAENFYNIYLNYFFDQLRLHGLKTYPANFGSTFDAEVGRSDQEWADRIRSGHIIGAFHGDELVGGLGYYKKDYIDGDLTKAGATIIAVIVAENYRGDQGKTRDGKRVIDKLFTFVLHAISHSEVEVDKVFISHVIENIASSKVYPRYGFKQTRISSEQHLDGKFYDEVCYELILRQK